MRDTDTCACGHVGDEHGHDPEYPGSTACTIDGCECCVFESVSDDEKKGEVTK